MMNAGEKRLLRNKKAREKYAKDRLNPEWVENRRRIHKKSYTNRSPERVEERKRYYKQQYMDNAEKLKQYQIEYRKRKKQDPEWVKREAILSKERGNNTRLRRRARKQYVVDLLGGKCVICGYNRNLNAIDLHEIEKRFPPEPSQYLKNMRGYEMILDNLEVLIPLCKNCHAELHSGQPLPAEFNKLLADYTSDHEVDEP